MCDDGVPSVGLHNPASSLIQMGNFQPTVSQIKQCYFSVMVINGYNYVDSIGIHSQKCA